MQLKKISSLNSKYFKDAWRIYKSSFPADERRPTSKQKKLFACPLYNFYSICEKNILLGIVSEWNLKDFLLIEHLAIKEGYRGTGRGTYLLKEHINNKNKVIVEVERPKNNISKKRIRFYEKIGFKLNKFGYMQPPYGKGKKAVKMFLMSYPREINKSEFQLIRKKLHKTVYGLSKPLI